MLPAHQQVTEHLCCFDNADILQRSESTKEATLQQPTGERLRNKLGKPLIIFIKNKFILVHPQIAVRRRRWWHAKQLKILSILLQLCMCTLEFIVKSPQRPM